MRQELSERGPSFGPSLPPAFVWGRNGLGSIDGGEGITVISGGQLLSLGRRTRTGLVEFVPLPTSPPANGAPSAHSEAERVSSYRYDYLPKARAS